MMRLTQHNTVYRRMLALSDTEQLPFLKGEVRERLERITKRWL